MCSEQIVSLIFDGLRSLAIATASIVGIYGINSWRKEARWKRKYVLAEEVLALVYEAKEDIAMIRNPRSWGGEGRTRKKLEHESQEESEIRDSMYVIVERSNSVNETFSKLQSLKFRFVAVFDQKNTNLIDELLKIRNKLVITSYRLADTKVRNLRGSKIPDQETSRVENYEKIIWTDYDENDEIEKEVNETVKSIENICKSIIKKSI